MRGIIRFDSITDDGPADQRCRAPISQVDSAFLTIILDTAHARIPNQIRFELYDVDDTVETDTLSPPVNALFSPNRRIGGITVSRDRFRIR